MDNTACEKSCDYLQRIYTEKPGACPKIKNQSNYVSSRFRHWVAPCESSSSRNAPLSVTWMGIVLKLPSAARTAAADNASCRKDEIRDCCRFQERFLYRNGRGNGRSQFDFWSYVRWCHRSIYRSIIIRWVMQKLTREQNAANSNLYVVQWRWGLHPDGESMTEWQTVTVVSERTVWRSNRIR